MGNIEAKQQKFNAHAIRYENIQNLTQDNNELKQR